MTVLNAVRLLSATSGTGTLSLGGAVPGFLTMTQAGAVDGQSYDYAIEAGFVNGVASAREVGVGVYSGGTLTRNVVNSTNGNALLNLSGDAQVIISVTKDTVRDRLNANRNYYVRGSDGSDANNGRTNTSGGAWLTIEHAVAQMAYIDFSGGWLVTINVAAGTYAPSGAIAMGELVGAFGGGARLLGDATTPSNVVINFPDGGFYVTGGPWQWDIEGFKITNADGPGVEADAGYIMIGNMEWGACSFRHVYAHNNAETWEYGNDTISGGSTVHWRAESDSIVRQRFRTITLTGTPAFSEAFISLDASTAQMDGLTFVGSATGVRAIFVNGSRAQIDSNSLTYFPGNAEVQINGGSSYQNIQGPLTTKVATVQTTNYTATVSDYAITFNNSGGSSTLTLPSAATYPGRWMRVGTTQNQTVVSNASNVVPLAGGSAGTAILAATAGKWALMQSDGATNWVIMASN